MRVVVPRVTGLKGPFWRRTLKARACDSDNLPNERNGSVIRQLPSGSRRPPTLVVVDAPGRSDGISWAVRSGRYRPPLDAVVEAVLPWLVALPPAPRPRVLDRLGVR
jgi:hypothetical protein